MATQKFVSKITYNFIFKRNMSFNIILQFIQK